MPKISRSDDNLVAVPTNVSILSNGYVYYNISTHPRRSAVDGHVYYDHKKECIGVLRHKADKTKEGKRWMYANSNYFTILDKDSMPERPDRDDCISVGLHAAVREVSEHSGLDAILTEVFGLEDACLVLDLATYMLSEGSAVFGHVPHWCRDHAIYTEKIPSDTAIGNFERKHLRYSLIEHFKEKWARHILDDGKIYLCYDSTNINSQAEGVFLVQKGYAKDDPSLEQVNTDYVIRQRDGLPVTYTAYPGSITDMAEASEITKFFRDLIQTDGEETMGHMDLDITVIADRGYISEDNVRDLDQAGINFLFMLRRNMGITDGLLETYAHEVKSSRYYFEEEAQYGMTVPGRLWQDDEKERYFHIIWDHTLETKHHSAFYVRLNGMQKNLEKAINRKIHYSEDQLKNFKKWFDLEVTEDGSLSTGKRGRGNKGKKTDVPAFVIRSIQKNFNRIDQDLEKCGFYILVTSKDVPTLEAMTAYRKRECVEKVFVALKSFLGMNKIGAHSDDAIIGKSFIWFIAAILHALIFDQTKELRTTNNKKNFTTTAIIDLLEEIKGDRNISTGTYKRRYKTIAKQNKILSALNLSLETIDEIIADLR